MNTASTKLAIAFALALALLGCGDKPPETTTSQPDALATCEALKDPQPKDESAAARGVAVAEGIAARNACKNAVLGHADKDVNDPNKDLARLRELAEKEDAEKAATSAKGDANAKAFSEGMTAPRKEYKY